MSTVPTVNTKGNDSNGINGSDKGIDPGSEISRFLPYLHPNGETFELICLGAKTGKSHLWEGYAPTGKKSVMAGWFKDQSKAAELAMALDKEAQPTAIYVGLNPCDPNLLGRACERLKANINRTSAKNITSLRNFLIDLDPVRPEGISSTDEEHQAALEKAREVVDYLRQQDWPEPLVGDSGNGGHCIYKINLQNTPENVELLKNCLKALSVKFSSSKVEVDEKVFDPPRITKLFGTTARKGDNIPLRPHRPARIISAPSEPKTVSYELLKSLADTVPQKTTNANPQGTRKFPKGDRFNVQEYLEKYGIDVKSVKRHGSSTLHILEECIFNSDHAGGEAAIGQTEQGVVFYQCFHNSCKDRTWAEARQLISGNDKLDDFTPKRADIEGVGQNTILSVQSKSRKILLPNPPPFPNEIFPKNIQAIISTIAQAHAVPLEIPAGALLVLTGACIGRTRGIQIKKGWIEHPNLYLALVGRSGTGKSPAANAIFRPVFDFEKQWFEEYQEEIRRMEQDDDKGCCPRWQQLLVEDASPEALSDALTDNPRGIFWYRDELSGLLLELDKYATKNGGTKARLMSAYDSGAWKVNRVTRRRNSFIPHATLSIFGTVQPKALPEIFSGLDSVTGFLPRFLFLRVDREKPPFWTEEGIRNEIRTALEDMVRHFLNFDLLDEDEPRIVPVSPAARMRYIEWYNQQVAEPWRDLEAVIYEALLSKLRGQCLRFCLILHCMDAFSKKCSELTQVSETTMVNAIRLADCFKEHQKQVWQFLMNSSQIEEISPIQKQVLRAILSLQNEIQAGMLPTSLITQKVNEGMHEKFHVSSSSVGKTAASLGFQTKHLPGVTTRGICITQDDLHRLQPLMKTSGSSGTCGKDEIPTEFCATEEAVDKMIELPVQDGLETQINDEIPVNEHSETSSTPCATCFDLKQQLSSFDDEEDELYKIKF